MELLPLSRLRGRIEARADFQKIILKCKKSSHQCGNACVPKTKKCRSPGKLRLPEQELTKIVQNIEDKIKDSPVEHAVVIDNNGKVVLSKTGDRTSVDFSWDEVEKMKGAIVTHNHPNLGWGKDDARSKGLSFSYADLDLAITSEVKEMRAVTSGYRHSLKPNPNGWDKNMYWDEIWDLSRDTYKKHEGEVYREFASKVITRQMPIDVAEGDYHHEVIKRTAKDLGMIYEREEIGKKLHSPSKKLNTPLGTVAKVGAIAGGAYLAVNAIAIAGLIASGTIKREIDKDNGGISIPQINKSKPLSSSEIKKSVVYKIEDQIKKLPYERGIIIDNNGSVVMNKGGFKTGVYFTPKEMVEMKGKILTHNHPTGADFGKNDPRYKGFGFSKPDIELACKTQLKEMRAVSNGYRHSLEPPSSGWDNKYWKDKVAPAYQKYEDEVISEWKPLVSSGKLDKRIAHRDIQHEVIKRTAKDLGMIYKREEI